MTASLSNTMLLSQVVLGAALTALGASQSSHILITVFGAMNTIIAGLVAYLKSRGQPMRARMFRDDLERVVDEIENSEIMWLGIARNVSGYDEIGTDEHQVTVRSEVARLTRLYERAVQTNTANNPDMYVTGSAFDGSTTALRTRPQVGASSTIPAPIAGPAPTITAPIVSINPGLPVAPVAPPVADPDESPATAAKPAPTPKEDAKKGDDGAKKGNDAGREEKKDDKGKEVKKEQPDSSSSGGGDDQTTSGTAAGESSKDPPPPAPIDPDAEPASEATVPKKKNPTANGET